ncbi:hypothetical protein A0257_11450 [Hymenobacter psoromatis]|nr:hypothetical protein A0257_11450 [Hymenobacter psoromatis]
MKTYLNFGLIFCILFGGLTGCHKKEATPTEPLVFSFQLLNEQGQETSVFAPNQNIIFHFEARNNTDQTMFLLTDLRNLDYQGLPSIYSFTKGVPQLVGRPYNGLCVNYVGGPHPVPAHDALQFTIKWLEPTKPTNPFENEPFCTHTATTALPKGHYYASFSTSFVWYQDGVTTTETAPPTMVREFDVQ